jgi:O-antigen/teichoic acid export membrane protein
MAANSLRQMLGSAMGARLAIAVFNYGLFWALSHRLPTAALGAFAVAMNLFLVVQALPLLGLSSPLIRRIAADHAQAPLELSNALAFALPVALLVALALGAIGFTLYPPELHGPILCISLAVLPTAWTLVAESTLLGLERMLDIARVQSLESGLRVLLAVAAISLGFGLTGVFVVFLGLRLLMAAIYLLCFASLPRPRAGLVRRELQRRNWGEVPVFFGIALLAVLAARLDIVLLSRLSGLRQTGIYAAAARLYEASLMLPTISALAMFPALSRLFASDLPQFRHLMIQSMRLSLSGGMVIALGVAAFAQPIIALLYKPEMAPAAAILRCLIFGAVLMTLDQILSSTMVAARAQAEDLRSLLVGLVTLVLGMLALLPAFGALGAAVSVTGALVVRVVWRMHWAARTLQFRRVWLEGMRQFLAALFGLAGLALGLMGSLAWNGAPAALLLALASYTAGMLATGIINPRSLHALRAAAAGLFKRPRD